MISDNSVIRFIVPVALTEVMAVLLPRFEAETGHRVRTVSMLNPEVPGCEEVAQGTYDLAVTNPPYVDKMVVDGHGAPESVRPFARAPLAFGATTPCASSPRETEAGLRELLAATSRIAITRTGTSGAMFARLAQRLGLAEEMVDRVIGLDGGGPMSAVLAGEVDLAALPLTNLSSVQGVVVRGICPVDWEVHIDLALVARQSGGLARELSDWLMASERDEALVALGAQRY